MRLVLVFALALAGGVVHADSPTGAVALLPLDADRDLELYGQPVAGEIARALVAGGIKVVIVGPKMAVPEAARLIVDGTIVAGKGDSVTLSVRVRDPRDGTIIDTLVVTAPMHTAIDQAAEELSGRVVPSVRARLATMEAPPEPHADRHPRQPPPQLQVRRPILASTFALPGVGEPMRAAFGTVLDGWAQRHHHEAKLVDPLTLSPETVSKQVTATNADFAFQFDVMTFDVDAGPVPTARAIVRVRISDSNHTVFDRVVTTDTVVGDRGLAIAPLAERVAREVLEIIEPHVKRAVATWK